MEDLVEDLISFSSDDSFYEIEHKANDIERILTQWKQNDKNAATTKTDNTAKFVDTRTFTRPKKKMMQSLENAFANTSGFGANRSIQASNSSPITPLNLQIGGQISTPFSMQRSWLNDVSPPGSLCTSMDFSSQERMNSSLITSGDFSNVSSFLTSHHTIGVDSDNSNTATAASDYCFDDLIRDRKFLDNLTNHESLNKDESLSKTDLSSIEEGGSAFNKTLENSMENLSLNVTTIKIGEAGGNGGNSTFVHGCDVTFQKPVTNETFNCLNDEENLDNVSPPKSTVRRLSGQRNKTFDRVEFPEQFVNRTFGATSPSLTTDRQSNINQTFDCDDAEPPPPPMAANQTFEMGAKPTNVNNETFENVNTTFNATFDSPANNQTNEAVNKTFDRNHVANANKTKVLTNCQSGDENMVGLHEETDENFASPIVMGVQSTPLQTPTLKTTVQSKLNSTFENQLSPITSKETAGKMRRTDLSILRNTKKFQDIQELFSPDDQQFDLPPLLMRQHNKQEASEVYESMPGQPNSRQSIEEKRISLLTFEDMEKSMLLLDDQQNEVDFDEILNTLTERRPNEHDKFRQSLDNIKKRHSLINFEKQQDDLKRKEATMVDVTATVDNKLLDSINSSSSMTSSSGSDRLLNRRSRLYDGMQNATMTVAPTNNEEDQQPDAPVERTNTTYDRKNRDRFKTIKINKKLGEGMVVIETDSNEMENQDDSSIPSNAFNKVNVNSPKSPTDSAETFKKPAPVSNQQLFVEPPKRSLSKPRYYSALPQSRKELTLPLAMKSSSSDNLDNKYSDASNDKTLVKSNLKSPMGVKSISYHNLVFNGTHANSSNNNLSGKSKLATASSGPIRPATAFSRATSMQPSVKEKQNALNMQNSNSVKSSSQSQLSNGPSLLKAPTSRGRPGLIRPSSGYFTYNSKRNDSDTESGRYSPNSLSSSSASSRGSLLQSDSPAMIMNPVQDQLQKPQSNKFSTDAVEPRASVLPRPSGLKPPSNLRMPAARSGLPRPNFVKR